MNLVPEHGRIDLAYSKPLHGPEPIRAVRECEFWILAFLTSPALRCLRAHLFYHDPIAYQPATVVRR
jgi:hypothetical protein